MTHIWWVEDQFHWVDKLKPALESADIDEARPNTVTVFKFAEAACQHIKLAKSAPDIAILDANMNGNNEAGFTVSRALLKKWPDLPIIYLSEHSGTDIEQQALEKLETQDFIAKHQDNIERILCWRIKAVMRQAAMKRGEFKAQREDVLVSGALTIDLTTWDVYWCGERLMNPKNSKRPLAPIPRKILKALVASSPRPLTTMQMEHVLDSDNFTYANYRQHIRTLRHAFEQVTQQLGRPSFIDLCKQGHGIVTFGDEGAYCWRPPAGE